MFLGGFHFHAGSVRHETSLLIIIIMLQQITTLKHAHLFNIAGYIVHYCTPLLFIVCSVSSHLAISVLSQALILPWIFSLQTFIRKYPGPDYFACTDIILI